ncbi:hypothetical protein Tco_1518042 [Tanacetum coccineum]
MTACLLLPQLWKGGHMSQRMLELPPCPEAKEDSETQVGLGAMSHSDELTYTNSTTTIFPRFLDTLPYVYTKGHLLRIPTLPSPSFYPRRTARMSVIPVLESDFTQQERTLATVPPYGIMVGENPMTIAATSRGEIVLTVCMNLLEDQLHTILEDMHNYPATCLAELEFFMTKWDVKPRVRVDTLEDPVDEMIARFRQVCEHADFCARDAQEKA